MLFKFCEIGMKFKFFPFIINFYWHEIALMLCQFLPVQLS